MGVVTANAWERVVKIESADSVGTGTIVEHGGRTYCVTARHVLPAQGEIRVSTRLAEWRAEPQPLDGTHLEADVAVFEVSNEMARQDLPLPLTTAGLVYSQEVFFLGYPYGLAMQARGAEQLPFVKSATLSSSQFRDDGLKVWYLDGMNNPGFSGGPVVAHPGGHQGEMQFAAVTSGYRADWQHVENPAGEIAGQVAANSGIIIAYDIKHALEALPPLEAED